jgi:Holliday junction resolvasome RuvABC ATP-dependent DNA helicase subunit
MDTKKKLDKWLHAAKVFTPGAPINKYDLFSGRVDQIRDVINAVMQRGRHVILFGERGVGKTSLANILAEALPANDYIRMGSGTVNCDVSDDFSTLWHKAFREIAFVTEGKAGFEGRPVERVETLDEELPEVVTPDDIRYTLERLSIPAVIIIDEIDRIQEKRTTTLLADTVKNLSDHSTSTTIVLVGVADSVGELIAEHASIERALVQVRMPRMSNNELFDILDKGLGDLEMGIDDDARIRIARLSQGLPQYTHSMGLYATQEAINQDRSNVTLADVEKAIKMAVDKAQQSILDAYHKATSTPRRENLYARALLACALAPTDLLGFFTAAGVRAPLSVIMGKPYDIPAFTRHLNEFSEPGRGPIIQKVGVSRKYRFRFVNPLMQPYVIAHGLAKGLISHQMLDSLSADRGQTTPETA